MVGDDAVHEVGDVRAHARARVESVYRADSRRVFATLDTEEYLDFQAARPTVELVDGVIREIQWPALAFSAGSFPGGGHDLVLLLGVEPNLRWPTFCDDVISVARKEVVRLDIEEDEEVSGRASSLSLFTLAPKPQF
jgi:hypothetical protein